MPEHEPSPQLVVNRAIIRNKPGELLAIRRAADDSYDGGSLEFPGGKVDPGETNDEALTREVEEETGIVGVAFDKLFRYTYKEQLTPETSVKYPQHLYVVNFRTAETEDAHVAVSHEHSEAVWLRPELLIQEASLAHVSRMALVQYIRHLQSL